MSMLPTPFEPLPDTSRLWLLALDAPPAPETRLRLMEGLASILAQWRHKGHAYRGACALLLDQVLAVAEPELAANPSGCAIDGMLRKVARLLEELGLRTVDPAAEVLVGAPGGLRALPKAELEARIQDGTLEAGTVVVDLALYTLGDLRAGKLESPLARTWIGRKFKVA